MFTSAVLFRRRAADMMIGRLRLRSSSVSYRIFATQVARSFAEPRRAASRLFWSLYDFPFCWAPQRRSESRLLRTWVQSDAPYRPPVVIGAIFSPKRPCGGAPRDMPTARRAPRNRDNSIARFAFAGNPAEG